MQTIILTGVTGGLGSALAQQLVKKGDYTIVCVYRNEEKFRKMFPNHDPRMQPYRTSPKDDFNRLEQTIAKFSTDEMILILNAFSIMPIKLIGDYSYTDMDQMIEGNIKQNITLLNKVIQICRNCRHKMRIINLDSGAADYPLRGWGNYCASKAYMNAFLSVAALENPHLKVVSFDPGIMDTNMQQQIRETKSEVFDQVETFISYEKNGKLVAPDNVAEQLIARYVSDWTATEFREKYRL